MSTSLQQIAKNTIALQAKSIEGLQYFINDSFDEAVQTVHSGNGRLVITGVGKSAIVAQKIVSTLNSTGTPSLFMHAADAIHGDLGMVQKNDVVLVISKSGESPEIKVLIPLIKNFGNLIIAITGNVNGYLAKHANYILNTTVQQEACPNNLAPTTSTTAQMVMGDALAIALMELNGFKQEDFARYHPGGNLGKRLFLKVVDLYHSKNPPFVKQGAALKEIIVEMTSKMLGTAAVVDENNKLLGVITDGDLRRMLEKTDSVDTITAKEIYSKNPKTINPQAMAIDALELMRTYNISQLLVANDSGEYLGVLHLHDLVREGII